MNIIVVAICGIMLSIGAILALVRIVRGPSILDRIVATDVMVATVFGAVALHAGWLQETYTLPVLVVLATVGFIGSVSVARFAAADEKPYEDHDNFNVHFDHENRTIIDSSVEAVRRANTKDSEGDQP